MLHYTFKSMRLLYAYIYHELTAKNCLTLDDVSLSTVQRYISKANLSAKKLKSVERLTFEFEFANECSQSDISVGSYLNIKGSL